MKWVLVLSLLFVAVTFGQEENLVLAQPCDLAACTQIDDCRCSTTTIPGGLLPRNTPQFVTVTFDDAVNNINIITYRNLIYGRLNWNQCPVGATFYVSHEYTDYTLVNELYNNRLEIALHSISHQTPQTYWAEATYDIMVQEFADQRIQMAHFANIPFSAIRGVRLPFLQLAGNSSFLMMANHDLLYDCTWATSTQTNPALWPYTLHFASTQDCFTPPCPTASIPGPWVMPMVSWTDLSGFQCSMVDACFHPPDVQDEDAWYKFILTNFERHYLGNRAPFPFYIHEWFLNAFPAVQRALVRFLNLINNLPDVFMVNSIEVMEWIQNPIPVDEYRAKPCRSFIPTGCPVRNTCVLTSDHNNVEYWLQVCNACPRVYPWLGNPLGQ